MKTNKIIKTAIALIIIAIFAIAIFIQPKVEGQINLGQISALSGIGSDIGVEERNSALLAVEEINRDGGVNGKKINMISEDVSLDKVQQTASAIQKLVNIDKAVAIVGPQWDESGSIAASLSKELLIPIISPNTSPQVQKDVNSEYYFSTFYSNEVGIRVLLDFAQKRGYKKIAIIQPANFGFWSYTSELLKENASEYGIEIVSEEYGTDFGNTDYKTLIAKTKSSNPDAVFGSYADLQCLFIQQMKNQNMNIPLLSTESAGNNKTLKECAGILENNLFFSTPVQSKDYFEFEKKYEARFGSKPLSPSAVTAYDAVYVTVQAINDSKSEKAIDIVNALKKMIYKDSASMDSIKFNDIGFVETNENAFEVKGVVKQAFSKAE